MTITLYPFQEKGAAWLATRQRGLLASEMGCLSGDTKIKVARGRNGFTSTTEYSLAEFFLRWIGGRWDNSVPTYIRAWTGTELKLHRVKNVMYSGWKKVWELRTAKGYSIKATGDHRFLTAKGYRKLSSLKAGSKVAINGVKYIRCVRCQKRRPVDKRLKFPDLCGRCSRLDINQAKRTTSKGLPPGQSYDKSGYVMVLMPDHPNANYHGLVRQHVLVAEAMVGRPIRFPADVVHHINGNKADNRPENLQITDFKGHAQAHGCSKRLTKDKHGNKIWWEYELDSVVSKTLIGYEHVFDIAMEAPHHNFVANGFVVHNCGKSFQILAALKKLTLGPGRFRILIVAPASLCPMWEEMVVEWFPDCSPRIVSSSCPPLAESPFTICSYHYLHNKKNLARLLKVGAFEVIICDEAHKMKTWSSLTTRAFRRLIRHHTGRLWLMTGTPASATGSDYYPYLKLLHDNPDQFGTLSEFRETYCEKVWDFWSQCLKYQGVKEDMRLELQSHLRTFTIRHRKKDVLRDLPPMQVQKVPIKVDRAIIKDAQAVIARFNYAGEALDPAVATVVRTTGLGKVPAALDWISGTRQPLVVFAIHTEVILKLEEGAVRLRRRVATITGKTKPKHRHNIVKSFQAGDIDVLICNMQAGGEGITLTRASTVLFVEETWKPDLLEQAMARVHRISQKAKSVHCIHLVARGTIDDAIWKNREKKLEFLREVLND